MKAAALKPNIELRVQTSSEKVCKLPFDATDRASTAADVFWKAQIASSHQEGVLLTLTAQTWSGRRWLTRDRRGREITKLDIYPN